jgi:CIC family chloride channel protein
VERVGDHPLTLGWQDFKRRFEGGVPVLTFLLAAATGLTGSLATLVFRHAISFLQVLINGQSSGLVEMAESLGPVKRVLIPTLGGILAGLVLVAARRIQHDQQNQASSDYMHSASVGDGRVPVMQSLLRGASSLLTITSGGSIGREGAMVQLAALSASVFGRAFKVDPLRLRLLVACGAAAGLTAAYNAPIASAFFVSEIVLGSFAMESFGPILVAAVVSSITMRALPGYHPTYVLPALPEMHASAIPLMLVLGVLGGLGSSLFLRLPAARAAFALIKLPQPLLLGLGGLGVGLISIYVPEVWGNGYSVVNGLLHNQWTVWAVLAIFIAKMIATAFTTGSGAIGGIFTPILFVGATAGWLFGLAADSLFPGAFPPSAFAVVGMGAFLAGGSGAPLMAILMIFEMTLSYEAMLPLTLACTVAWTFARGLGAPAMYETVVRRAEADSERARLAASTVASLIHQVQTVVPQDAGFDAMMKIFLAEPIKYIYVTDARGFLCGGIALQDLARLMQEESDRQWVTAASLMRRDFPYVTASALVTHALAKMQSLGAERVPVIESEAVPKLLGVVRKSDVIALLGRLADRSAF